MKGCFKDLFFHDLILVLREKLIKSKVSACLIYSTTRVKIRNVVFG
jgi:hypothetical protein